MEERCLNMLVERGFCFAETGVENLFLFYRDDSEPICLEWEELTQMTVEYYLKYVEHFSCDAPSEFLTKFGGTEDGRVVFLMIVDLNTIPDV